MPCNNASVYLAPFFPIILALRISPATQVLPYSFLQTHLEIPTIRLLEDLIIDAIYLDIIRGKLDQKEQQFEVEYTIGRDVPPEAVTEILTSLENWSVVFLGSSSLIGS